MELKVQQYCEIEWDYLIHLQPNFNLRTHNSCVNSSNQKYNFLRNCRKQMGNFSHEHEAPHRKKTMETCSHLIKRSYFCLQLHANHVNVACVKRRMGKQPRCFANKGCCCCCCCCRCCVVVVVVVVVVVAVEVVEAVVVIVAVVVVVVVAAVVVHCFSSLLSLWLLLVIVVVVVLLLRSSVPLLCAHQL